MPRSRPGSSPPWNWRGRFAPGLREVEQQIKTQAAVLGFAIDPRSRIDELSIAERQRVVVGQIVDAPVELGAGDNAVLVRTEQRRGPWAFSLRVLEPGTVLPPMAEIGPAVLDEESSATTTSALELMILSAIGLKSVVSAG